MKSGPMRYLAELIRLVEVGRNEYNLPIYDLATVARFWASKTHKSEDEAHAASQVYSTRVVTWRTHFIEDVRVTDTLRVDGTDYDVVGIRELGFRAGTEITAKATE